MKTKFVLILSLLICVFSFTFAQNDADNYWILEDFSSFDNTGGWIDDVAEYETYPNDVKITTYAANVEPAEFCAATISDNLFRIRGLAGNGYLQFTVPNASTVKIYVSGKSDNLDRTVCIYRNDELVQIYEKLDRTVCRAFVDNVNSQTSVTYKITGGVVDSTDPVTVYYVEVAKYGVETNKDQEEYWIKEDFASFDNTGGWIAEETSYESYPNNIAVKTTYANVEVAGDCASANALGNQMRIGGLTRNGSLTFTVPDATLVKIHVTGKSSSEDRSVRIYRNDELVKTYENLDKNVCRIFTDYVFSQEPLTYKVTGGDEDSDTPMAVYNIEVIKYGIDVSDPAEDYTGYWIYEDFSEHPIETGYSTGFYESFPNNLKINSVFANVEWGEGCTAGGRNVRISCREGEDGSILFSVPNYQTVEIGLTGKSTNLNRNVQVYVNNDLFETFTNLDRDVCVVSGIATTPESPGVDEETTFKIVGVNNDGSPIAVSYIHVSKANSSIDSPKTDIFGFYPNPATDVIYFRTTNQSPVEQAWIFDVSGKQIRSVTNALQMNISSLNKGIYILKVKTEDGIVVSNKLIKQ